MADRVLFVLCRTYTPVRHKPKMGTSATVKMIRGKKAIYFYDNFDGYPRELGVAVLNMLKKMIDAYGIEGLQSKFDEVKLMEHDAVLTEEEINKMRSYFGDNTTDISWYPGLNHVYDMETIIGVGFAQKYQSTISRDIYVYILNLDDLTVQYDNNYDNVSDYCEKPKYSFAELDIAIADWKKMY